MEEKSTGKYSIIGFPDDLGIRNVNGRLGAVHGPQAFLEAFLKLNGKVDVRSQCLESLLVSMGNNLEFNLARAAQAVERVQSKTLVVVGGGHDYAYAWIKGLTARDGQMACINIDAHFDLRPYDLPPHGQMNSGAPFRRLITEGVLKAKNLVEFGIQSHCNSRDLWEYAAKMKIKTVPFESLRATPKTNAVTEFKKTLDLLKKTEKKIVISLDLDALSFAFAPGVSAPQAEGFSASEVFEMLEIAGSDKKVTSLGIFELSPPLDIQNYTSRLAAQAAWHFLSKKIK